MKVGRKRWPRLPDGRLRPVVSVKLDDGTELEVDQDDLRAYTATAEDYAGIDARGGGTFAAINHYASKFAKQAGERAAARSKKANATAPRAQKEVTREVLLAFRNDFAKKHNGSTRGCVKAMQLEFGLSAGAIARRMQT